MNQREYTTKKQEPNLGLAFLVGKAGDFTTLYLLSSSMAAPELLPRKYDHTGDLSISTTPA